MTIHNINYFKNGSFFGKGYYSFAAIYLLYKVSTGLRT